MKKIQRIFAVLLAAALLSGCSISAQQMLLLSSVGNTKFIRKIETPTSTPQPTATPKPTSTPKPTATPFVRTGKSEIVLLTGMTSTYTVDQMHAALDGKPVLLRNSCMDKLLDCDLSFLYEVIDFAVLKGITWVELPLTEEEYAAIKSKLCDEDLFPIMYPFLHSLQITKRLGSYYRINFSFRRRGSLNDAEILKQYAQARNAALDIVKSMPAFSKKNDQTKLFYLYSYITHFVKYSERSNYWDVRGSCPLYDALVERDTVCAGFAYAFAYLCEMAGIDAQWVHVYNSRNDDGHHAVVIATLQGALTKSYWFDPTWDAGRNLTGFEFFGISDADMFRDHDGIYATRYPRSYYPSKCSDLSSSPADRTNSRWFYWDFDTMTLRGKILNSNRIKAGRYCISSKLNQNYVLEISGSSSKNGGNAQIWYNNFTDNQQFDLIQDGDGFVFKNRSSKLVLDVERARAVSGTNVQQYEKNGGSHQRWIIKPCDGKDYESGYYYIVSDLGDRKLYLEVAGDKASGGANVRIASFTGKDNQKWRFTEVNKSSVSDGRYIVTSALSNNSALTVDYFSRKEGANAQIYYGQDNDSSFANYQKFDVCKVSGGYVLKCIGSELVLSIQSSSLPTKNVVQKAYGYYSVQKWTLQSAGNGYFFIKSAGGNYYLEVAGTNAADGANVQAAAYTGKDNQKWRFNLISELDVYS